MQRKLRLSILNPGKSFSWMQRAMFPLIRRMAGGFVPGPILTLSYKRKMFGRHFTSILQRTMRERKHWSTLEVEIFASFSSQQLQCNF